MLFDLPYYHKYTQERMAKYTPESVLASAPNMETLKRFVQLLNTEDHWSASLIEGRQKIGGDYRPVKRELGRLVQAWIDSGPNVRKLLNFDPLLDREARRFRPHFIPTEKGTARLAYVAIPEFSPHSKPFDIAVGLFLNFLLNPYNERLGGPCKHCSKYYVKNTMRQTAYCSKKCGLKRTSLVAIQKQRLRERVENLEQAKKFSARWAEAKTSKDWKAWVHGQTSISKNFLTRAVKKGELVVPVKKPSQRT
jgi:hypothetical protein